MSGFTGACITILLRFYDFDQAMQWLQSPQRILGGEVPARLIYTGRGQEVLDALRSLDEGTFV